MNDKDVFAKTEAGREEMRTRALHLSGALRNVLLLVDGNRTVSQLKDLMAGGKASPDALVQLLGMSLIELISAAAPSSPDPPSLAPQVSLPVPALRDMPLLDAEVRDSATPVNPLAMSEVNVQRFDRLYTLMNELVSDYLGLRGYFMQLRIEKCANAEELLALHGELGTALAKVHGKDVANELMARLGAVGR